MPNVVSSLLSQWANATANSDIFYLLRIPPAAMFLTENSRFDDRDLGYVRAVPSRKFSRMGSAKDAQVLGGTPHPTIAHQNVIGVFNYNYFLRYATPLLSHGMILLLSEGTT